MALMLCLAMATAIAVPTMFGCSNEASSAGSESEGQQVAATVLGQDITEDEVTAYIDSYRNGTQRADDEMWAEWLAEKGITAQELRTTTIYELAAPIIVNSKAEELGITADEEAVEAQVDAMRHSLLVEDDEAWEDELERFGMTEEKLRQNYSNKNLEEQVFAEITKDLEPTEQDLQNYVESNLPGVYTKKIGCIYGEDNEKVQAALASVQEASSVEEGVEALKGRLEEAGVDYAEVGWNLDAELTSGMSEVVGTLEKGQIAEEPLVEGDTSYVFYIEDDYTFPTDASPADFSDEGLKQAVTGLATTWLKQTAGSAWLQRQIEENIVINDMPEGLSYDVELPAKADDADAGEVSKASSSESATSKEGDAS